MVSSGLNDREHGPLELNSGLGLKQFLNNRCFSLFAATHHLSQEIARTWAT
tara:strand:+ start:2837 stop:2989 length:153 start_codon:yes stop_codon:yes gene_type:complete